MWLHIPSPYFPSVPATPESASACDSRNLALSKSVTWNGKPVLPASWSRVCKTAPWMTRLFGAISRPSAANRGAAEFIRSLPVTPASRSLARASSLPTKTRTTSGRTSRASSAKSSPGKSSSKTSMPIFDSASTKSPANWTAWATALRADSLARRKSAHRIAGSDSSHWLTVTLSGSGNRDEKANRHLGHGPTLNETAKDWRTPNTRDHHAQGTRLEAEQRQLTLVD